jgi:hypothetical protein
VLSVGDLEREKGKQLRHANSEFPSFPSPSFCDTSFQLTHLDMSCGRTRDASNYLCLIFFSIQKRF